jgi:hypothetical protein
MKATTVRFGDDLWALLADEASRAGVSVSQYVREAALARAAFAAGRRADLPGELLATWAHRTLDPDAGPTEKAAAAELLIAAFLRGDAGALVGRSAERAEETAALIEQSRLTARRAREVRRSTREPDG